MAKLKPDYSLIRNGEPLPYWLPRLVSPDPATRQAAGDALEGMAWGLPSYSTDWDDLETFPDTQAQQVRFEAALRAALDAHDFPRAAFVADLCMYRLALHSVHLRSFDHRWARRRRHDRRVAQLTTRLTRSLDQANPNAVSGEDRERLLQLVPTYLENAASHPGDNNGGEAISGPGMASCRIMRLLGPYLVAAPVAVEALLDDSDLRREALESLSHAGPAGMPFAPRLIRDLDRAATLPGDQYWHFDAFQALGSIGQDDPGVVAAMISRLGHGDARIRRGAASVLREMDADVCGREREIVERLRPMIDRDNEAYDALTAVASVGRHIPEVRQYICHLAGPRPPPFHPERHR